MKRIVKLIILSVLSVIIIGIPLAYYNIDKLPPLIVREINQSTGLVLSTPKTINCHITPQPNVKFDSISISRPDGNVVATMTAVVATINPLQSLYNLALFLTLKFGGVSIGKFSCQDISTKLMLQPNLARFTKLNATCYQAKIDAVINLAKVAEESDINLSAKITNLDLSQLLASASNNLLSKTLGGTATITLSDISSHGQDDLLRNMHGKVTLAVDNGVIKGLDLGMYIKNVLGNLHENFSPQAIQLLETKFLSLTGTGTIDNGIISNKDLNIKMNDYNISGYGTINLNNDEIDYNITVNLVNTTNQIFPHLAFHIINKDHKFTVSVNGLKMLQELGNAKATTIKSQLDHYVINPAKAFIKQHFN